MYELRCSGYYNCASFNNANILGSIPATDSELSSDATVYQL